MAEVVTLSKRLRCVVEQQHQQSSEAENVNKGELVAFTGIDFTEMRRIMDKYGFSTNGLPGAPGGKHRRCR